MSFAVEFRKVMDEILTNERPLLKIGNVIDIEMRLCSDNIQPNITQHSHWDIIEILEPLKNGATRIRVTEHNSEASEFHIVNSDRFKWEVYTPEEVNKLDSLIEMAEKEITRAKTTAERKRIEREVSQILEYHTDIMTAQQIKRNLTEKEFDVVYISHLIAIELGWRYVVACKNTATNGRISEYKKIGRCVDSAIAIYNEYLKINGVKEEISKLADEVSDDEEFQNVSRETWRIISNELYNGYNKDVEHKDLRIIAYLGIIMMNIYAKLIDYGNEILKEKVIDIEEQDLTKPNKECYTAIFLTLQSYVGKYILEYEKRLKTQEDKIKEIIIKKFK